MKSWILLIVLAVALTAGSTLAFQFLSLDSSSKVPEFPAASKPDGPAPKLVIDGSLTYDFNVLSQQTKGKHEWTFRNEGPGILEVRGSATTCSCTTSDLFEGKVGKEIELKPGESRPISVSWDTKTFEGHYRQFVTVVTNDPEQPKVELIIEGTVKKALVTIPADSMVGFLGVANDEPAKRLVMIASPDHPEMKITGFSYSNPNLLSAEVRDVSEEDLKRLKFEKAYWIEITLKPSPYLGDFNDEVVVQTDHPDRKSHTIRVRGKVTGPVSLTPDRVTMADASAFNGGSQVLTIWDRSRPEVNFTVEKKPKGMDVSIVRLPSAAGAKGSSYRMTVKLDPGVDSGLIEDEILLKSDDPKAGEIRVPVSVVIKGTR